MGVWEKGGLLCLLGQPKSFRIESTHTQQLSEEPPAPTPPCPVLGGLWYECGIVQYSNSSSFGFF